MAQRIQVKQPAEPGAHFAPDAFNSQIGKTVAMNLELSAEVGENGRLSSRQRAKDWNVLTHFSSSSGENPVTAGCCATQSGAQSP